MKGIFANHSTLFQTGILFVMLLTGFVISSFIVSFISFAAAFFSPIEGVAPQDFAIDMLNQPVWLLQCSQFVSAICMFLFPALSTAWLCSDKPNTFLYIRTFPDIRLLSVIILMKLLLSPTVSLTSYFNAQIHLPASMAAIEEWIKSTEELANSLIQKIITEKGVVPFILNLMVIAVAAAVTEEFLFRGALLRIVQRKIPNHHIAIWIVAIIFSAIHFQFYGFIPRMILGAYLGYLLYWTKNIWVPVFAHFFHNAVALIGMSNESLKENVLFSDEIASEDLRWFSITAGICLLAFIYVIGIVRKIGKPQPPPLPERDEIEG